ncbi:MAG: type pilus assembly protein PilM [Pseudomonadota bacterium]|nr:type pilus assembly protein PilM [Pseudomonadota bacterium]
MQLNFNLDWLTAKSLPIIGLDISTTAIKLVELSDAGKGMLRVERYVIEPLPKDAVTDGNIANLDQVADTLRTAWKALGTRIKYVALALPSSAVITKKILAPASLKGIDLENQVEAEANQVIPFSMDEVNLDFQVLGPSPSSPDDVQILLAAARKEKVEDRVAVVEAAGLKAFIMDVESYAAQTAYEQIADQLPNSGAGQTVAIIDVGAQNMHINILNNNESVYLREHGFGGNQLNNEISRRFGMSSEEAESAKRKGTLPESYGTEVLQPYTETLAMEIARALQLFTTSTQYQTVDHILLAGGGVMIPGIDDVVAKRTGTPTLVINPFANMAVGTHIRPQALTADAPSLFVACGLAMRRFDS